MRTPARGFTLTELLVTLLIATLLITIALPAMREMIAKRRLDGAANELSADLQQARTLAVADNVAVTLATTSTSTYTVAGNQNYKSVNLPTGVTFKESWTVVFQPLRGCIGLSDVNCTGSEVTINLESSGTSGKLRLVVSNMGRVQLCSPSGSFGGFSTC